MTCVLSNLSDENVLESNIIKTFLISFICFHVSEVIVQFQSIPIFKYFRPHYPLGYLGRGARLCQTSQINIRHGDMPQGRVRPFRNGQSRIPNAFLASDRGISSLISSPRCVVKNLSLSVYKLRLDTTGHKL